MKFITALIFTLLLSSCAHHHKKPEHHHHAYEKQCAYSVLHGEMSVKGLSEYKVEHGQKTYYFSSKDKMVEFKKNLKTNVATADKNWKSRK